MYAVYNTRKRIFINQQRLIKVNGRENYIFKCVSQLCWISDLCYYISFNSVLVEVQFKKFRSAELEKKISAALACIFQICI